MDDTDKKIATLVIIISLVIVSYGGFRVISGELSKGAQPEFFVERGDTVTVEYMGILYDTRIYGTEPRVFDTNIQAVSLDNNTHPKTATYVWSDQLSPFEFEVGTGSVISGWEINIIGMKIGERATWHIPEDQAYQPRLEELVRTYNKTMTNPAYETLTRAQFETEYAGYPAAVDIPLTHARWGWPARVFTISETHVTIENMPLAFDTYTTGYGWNTYIASIESSANSGEGLITMEHRSSPGDLVPLSELAYFDYDMSQVQKLQNQNQRPSNGIVVSVGTDTFQVDYNNEVYGKTLTFTLTILDIKRG